MTSDSYTALISPDAYDYLDNTKPEDLLSDPMLEEQEALEDAFDYDEDEPEDIKVADDNDDSDAYSGTLFDFDDDDLDEQEKEGIPSDNTLMFDDDDDDNLVIEKTEEKQEEKPKVKKERLLDDICAFCSDKYNDIFKYIRDCSEEDGASLADAIIKTRDAFFKDGKDKLFAIPGTEISIAVINDNSDPMLYTQRLEFVAANMLVKGRGFWNLLLLIFKENGDLKDAKFVSVSRSAFSEGEWRIANNMAFKIKEKMQ